MHGAWLYPHRRSECCVDWKHVAAYAFTERASRYVKAEEELQRSLDA